MYATAQDLIDRFDVRLLGDLASDTDAFVAEADLPSNARIAAALTDASAVVDSALLAAGKLTQPQLDEIKTDGDPTLRRIVSDLALGDLYSARGRGVPDGHRQRVDRAEDDLAAIRRGTHAINVSRVQSSSVPGATRSRPETRSGQRRVSDSPIFGHDRGRLDPLV